MLHVSLSPPPNKLWQLVIEEHYLYLVRVSSILQHAEVHGAQHVISMRLSLRASVCFMLGKQLNWNKSCFIRDDNIRCSG